MWEYFAAIRQVCNVFTAFTYLCVCLSVHKLYHCLFCKTSYHYTGDMEGYEIFSNARNLYKDGSLFNRDRDTMGADVSGTEIEIGREE